MKFANLRVLKSREIKKLKKTLSKQYSFEFTQGYIFMITKKNKVYILNNDAKVLDINILRIDHAGMYLGELREDGMRLSIDGSQLVGTTAKKQILNVTDEQAKNWLAGENLELENPEVTDGYVILKNNQDFIGCGKLSRNILYNFVPKARRVKVIS